MANLLIELFSEEIPARMQTRAAADLKKRMTDGLVEAGLTYGSAGAFSTPRRLALSVEDLLARSPDTREERKGPKADAPEKAVEGFLRSTGLTRDQLETRTTPRGEVLFAVIEKPGRPAAEIVAEVLEGVVRSFPWPKSMRWGSGNLRWVRPLQSILCILTDEHGASVVPLDVDGLKAGDTTEGHRFMTPGRFAVTGFEDYRRKLFRADVILSAEERAETIWNDATNRAFASGLEVVEDRGLLTEVAGLVEWPVVLMGEIEERFLRLPPEVLQTSMREHQKFFSVRDPKQDRIVRFVTVANRETADDGATILAGNRKVLAARLSDALFFWDNDLRVAKQQKMQPWLDSLDHVTFHAELGSQGERIARIAGLAGHLAPYTGADPDTVRQAARVAKADLASEMVYEFPELQGVMGRYYAIEAGLPGDVADAARDHYAPLGPSDDVPTAPVSVTVALADKLDMLTGFWAIDEKPTGSKDPYALRRAALGVIRLILTNNLRIPLDRIIHAQILRHQIETHGNADEVKLRNELLHEIARHGILGAAVRAILDRVAENAPQWIETVRNHRPDVGDDLLGFIHDRLKVHLRDEGVRHDVIDACLAMPGKDDLALLVARAHALQAVVATDEGENLLQAFRRAANILAQAEEKDGVEYSYGADPKFAETEEERALFAALDKAEATIRTAMEVEDFQTAMHAMAALREPLDAFFEAVQVNTDNQIVRRNRLNLLSRIRAACLEVADLTRIAG